MPKTAPTTEAVRTAIQNKLVELGKDGRFFRTRYDRTGFAQPIIPTEAERVAPSSCLSNEVSGGWEEDSRYGREVAQRRTSWQFELLLEFDCEVSLEFFEYDMTRPVPRIDTPHGSLLPRLVRSEYLHPTQASSSGGTSVTYTYEVLAGRF